MVDELRAYRGSDYELNSKIRVHQPTLGEIADYGEQRYFSLVHYICSTPADRKVEIWDSRHVYWDTVDEYDLFISIMLALRNSDEFDTKILFPDLDFKSMSLSVNAMKSTALMNKDGVVIDRSIHKFLTDYLRQVHRLKKNVDVGYNDYTKDIMIEDDRDEMRVAKKKEYRSQLKPLISALTCATEFKYRWDDIWVLPIGVFMDSVERVQRNKNYTFLMEGIYHGTIDSKKIRKKEFNWLAPLE